MKQDLYAILGVSKDATPEEIKKAYRRLAKSNHPDQTPDDPHAELRFKEISGAFAVLSEPDKRALYDEFGPDGLREGFDADVARNYKRWAGQSGGGRVPFDFGGGGFGGFGDLDDLLSGLFGGGAFGGRRVRHKGQDLEAEVTISLRQAIEGTEIPLPEEGGKARIPAGVGNGQRLRIPGRGGHGPAGRGDLFVKVHVATPLGFTSDGDDLGIDLPVRVATAVLGGVVELPTPTGGTANLRIPPGSQSGQRIRVKGQGLTHRGGRGHLYARVMVQVPTGDDPELAELVGGLERFYE